MSWLSDRYSHHVSAMYNGGLYDSPDKLDVMGPLIVGGVVFAAIDLGIGLQGPMRWVLLAILVGPGVLWAALLLFHEFRSLPGRYRRHKALSDGEE